MPVAIGLWSLELTPGKEVAITPESDLRITNVSLGETLVDASGRSVVKFSYLPAAAFSLDDEDEDEDEDEESNSKRPTPDDISTAVLCSLIGGKIESTTVDIILEEEHDYIFEVTGKNSIHLIGNYIDQDGPSNMPPYEDDSDFSDEEDAFDLRDVSSDVAMDPADLDTDTERFEEVSEVMVAKSGKRPRPSPEEEPSLSKSEKKATKKLKAADGGAVPSTTSEATSPAQKTKEKKDKKDKEKKKSNNDEDSTRGKIITQTLPGGLKIEDHRTGSGPRAKKGDRVKMRYIGKLSSGKVFDENTKGKPFNFKLGAGEVIKGWDEGVVGMQVGTQRVLVVPASMAYGNKKMAGIPANSTLTFEVKLLEIY